MENNENKTTQTALRVLVIFGILAILVFLSIGIVRIVPKALNALANASVSITSLFNGGNKNATSTAATSTSSTSGFVIISTSTPSVIATTTSSTGANTNTNTNTRGNVNSSTYTSHTTRTNTYSYGSSNSGSTHVSGTPDLVVSVLEKGIIDRSTGRFVATNNFTTSDTVVVKFKVENRGVGSSGNWSLYVSMPSLDVADQIRNIPNIGSIPPGAAIEGQAVFDRPRSDNNPSVVITADPANVVAELNETNNSAVAPLYVTGTNGNGGQSTSVLPDLSIRNLQVGILGANNQFIPTNSISSNTRVAFRFEVANTGSNPTGPWYFKTEVSDNPARIYNSSAEASIAGNTSVVYTVEYDNVRYGGNIFTIFLDPNNYLAEYNEANNTASVNFTKN